jgi:pimeloyl-ACP methyl ester carboxylesterase
MRIDVSDQGAGETVVLIHGGASNNRQWRVLVEDLKDRFRVIAPNLYGAGETPHWTGANPHRLVDSAALVEQVCVNVEGPVTIVGHSFGGAVAMQAAAQLGGRVGQLILLEAAPYDLLRQHGRAEAYREARDLYEFVREGSIRGDWTTIAEKYFNAFAGGPLWQAMSEEKRSRATQLMLQNRCQWEALMNDTTPLEKWSRCLPRRTLLVSASDTWLPLRELEQLFKKGCPHWTFASLPTGGHIAAITRPELVNPIIVHFISQGHCHEAHN